METLKKLRKLLSNSQIKDTLDLLRKICRNNSSLENRVVLLSYDFNYINERERIGLLTGEEVQVEKRKLINNILNFLPIVEEKIDYQLVDLTTKRDVEFLASLELTDLKSILLVGHTGRNLLTNFHQMFENSDYISKPSIKILLRNPYAETQNRFHQVYNSIKDIVSRFRIRNYDISINFYEAIPSFRCIICEYNGGKRISFISFYSYWPQQKTKAWDKSFIINDTISNKNYLVEYTENWFVSFFGKKEIHTIVFDFDDTIADTLNLQVEAWYKTIKKLIKNNTIKESYLHKEVQSCLNNSTSAKMTIKRIFLEAQMAEVIKTKIFSNVPTEKQKIVETAIKSFRFNEREKLTRKRAKLFSNTKETLIALSNYYKLAIISSTSEVLITEIIRKHGLLNLFTDIYGKHGPKQDWDNIEDKSEKLIKLSKKIGVSLTRMVYVGDNYSDYKATKQLGIKFIEARIQALRNNIETLIKYEENENPIYFSSYEDDSLVQIIEGFNQELRDGKEKLNINFLKEN